MKGYNTYIGARYVPIFDGEWDNSKTYEPLTIVSYNGSSYTSKTFVPTGASITNNTYWALTGNYNAQVESYREEVETYTEAQSRVNTDIYDKIDNLSAYVTLEMFGGKSNDVNAASANVEAFAEAIASHKSVVLGSGTYYINDTIENPQEIVGQNARLSAISMLDATKPIIHFTISETQVILDGFRIKYNERLVGSTSFPNANAILVDSGLTLGQSVFSNLFIENVYCGIYSNGEMYSDTIRDIWIDHYYFDAIHLEGAGTTGSILSNVYITNWEAYAERIRNRGRYGIFLQNFSEGLLQQINVEHTINASGVYFNQCEGLTLESIHFEGYIPKANYAGVVTALTSNVRIGTMTVSFSGSSAEGYTAGSTTATEINLFAMLGVNTTIICDFLNMRNNSWSFASNKHVVYSNDDTDLTRLFSLDTYTTKDVDSVNGFVGVDLKVRTPQVMKIGKTEYWNRFGNDRVIHYIGGYTPSNYGYKGIFNAGDRFINVVSDSVSEYVATKKGNFSEPALSATGYAEAYMSSIYLSNNNDHLTVGDRIAIGSTAYTVTTAPYSSSAHEGYPWAINVTPNVVSDDAGTGLALKYAPPEIKSVALV